MPPVQNIATRFPAKSAAWSRHQPGKSPKLLVCRVDPWHLHRHDFLFQPHLQPLKRHGCGGRIFDVKLGAAGQRADMCDDRGDALRAPRDRPVHPLPRKQQRALHPLGPAEIKQGRAQRGGIVERRETIQGGDGEGHDGRPLAS
jgi:hypothetical protein